MKDENINKLNTLLNVLNIINEEVNKIIKEEYDNKENNKERK